MGIQFPNRFPRLKQGPEVVAFGDSQTSRSNTTSASTIFNNSIGGWSWAQVLSGQRFFCPVGFANGAQTGNNLGLSGDTVANALTRLPLVLALEPDVCVMWLGTNDLNGTASAADVDVVFSKWRTINDTLIAARIRPVVSPAMPRGDYSAAEISMYHYYNDLIRRYVAENPEVILADPLPYLVDPASANGAALAGMLSVDGVHTLTAGAFYVGKAIHEALQHLYPPTRMPFLSQADVYDATYNVHGNAIINGLLNGTGGTDGAGCTGDYADSWTALRTAGSKITCVGSKVARPDGFPGTVQRLVFATDGTGAAVETVQFRPLANVTTVAGHTYQLECEVEVIASAPNVVGLFLQALGGGWTIRDMTGDGSPLPDVTWKGVFKTQPWVAGGAGMAIALFVTLDGTVNDSLTLDVSRFEMRRMD